MGMKWTVGFILWFFLFAGSGWAQEAKELLTLEESIKIALERSLKLHSTAEGVVGSEFRRKAAMTDFLPKWTGQYSYTRYNTASSFTGTSASSSSIASKGSYNFGTSITQPLFSGGSIYANYRLEKMGVDVSKTDVETVKRDLIVQVREGYFNILKAEKFLAVAQQAVKQFEAQLEVTKAFFEVGIVPKNDLLQAEVRLANARQGLVRAENDLAVAKALFNTLLRREINAPLSVVDILEYKPFPLRFEESLDEALRQRPEIKNADLKVAQAKESVKIARSGFFPVVSLAGNYNKLSEEPGLMGDLRAERWSMQALATLTLWEWKKTAYKVGESKVKVTQAEDSKVQLTEGIVLEVKDDYLNMLVAEKNIGVSEKAIEQAEENLRMNEERYKYQVATATDVLDAVTLLAQTRVNYYSALSDFNIAKARLERAMGRMYP
jgi:outer membrane protein TolC